VTSRPGEKRHDPRCALALGLVCGLLALAPPLAAQESQESWSGVERVIAFADVHGAYEDLTDLLRKVGVVDADLHWAAGKAHVVSTGDLLDRGAGLAPRDGSADCACSPRRVRQAACSTSCSATTRR
jgi:hypothetical protein